MYIRCVIVIMLHFAYITHVIIIINHCKHNYVNQWKVDIKSIYKYIRGTHPISWLSRQYTGLLPDKKQIVLQLDSVSQTLRLLGAPVEPLLDLDSEFLLLKHSFAFIVHCLQTYFSNWYLSPVCRPWLTGIIIFCD